MWESCAEKMCKLNVQTEPSRLVFCCRTCKPSSFSLPTAHTHTYTQRNPMIHRGMDEQNNSRMSNVMKDKNEQIAVLSYLSGFVIHPCFLPLWQVTVPLSLFRVKQFKAPC